MPRTTDRASAEVSLLPELTNVVLTAPIEQGRHKLPVGSVGTIVSVFPKTGTYTIEFFEPISCAVPAVGKDVVKPDG